MFKLKQVPIFIGLAILSSHAQAQSGNQSWECALDLHQGDKGTLTLNREEDNLDGVIRFSRNDNVFESTVSGTWNTNRIDLTRLLDAGSTELMTGVVVALGTKKMNIGGRYSDGYQGVWSANCDLVSEVNQTKSAEDIESEVFTETKVTPEMPTDIKQLSVFLGSEEIHTCAADKCEFSYGPFSKGIYSWRVEGLSNSDAKSIETGRLIVKSSKRVAQLKALIL